MFLAEKGVTVPTVQVDLRANEQLTPDFRKLNPWCTVPVLELDDGTAISEAIAICRYLEAAFPDPALMGRTPAEQGVIAMWEHRCEVDGWMAAAEAFRNATPGFKVRALPGPADIGQIPALVERGRARVLHFFDMLDRRLADSPFVGGPAFSVADITAFIAIEFAGWSKLKLPEAATHARRWHGEVSARPSAQA
jgi:glutathione S-transferase